MQKQLTDLQKIVQLRKIIFDSEFPVESVSVHEVVFDFTFLDVVLPSDLRERIKFFDRVIMHRKISQKFISFLPHAFFQEISIRYQNFQIRIGTSLLDTLKDFVKSPESRELWRLYKNSKPEYVIHIVDNTLNSFQKQWITLNACQDVKDNATMVSNIFESLQPWLDKELYAKVKEEESFPTRENVLYDDVSEDDRLRAKAKKLVKEKKMQKPSVENDADIIILSDE